MSDTIKEGLGLVQELAGLPFKAAREVLRSTRVASRPIGQVVEDSLRLAEGTARLPWRAVDALLDEVRRPSRADLEERVTALEREMAAAKAAEKKPLNQPPANPADAPEPPAGA